MPKQSAIFWFFTLFKKEQTFTYIHKTPILFLVMKHFPFLPQYLAFNKMISTFIVPVDIDKF